VKALELEVYYIQVYHGNDNGKIEVFRNNETNITPNIATNSVNITNMQNHKAAVDTERRDEHIQKPSQPSPPSPSSDLEVR
jgi:hypothetical protein